MTKEIEISEEFKATIKYYIDRSETNRVDHILSDLLKQCIIDEEFGHLIYETNSDGDCELNEEMDAIVLDAVEDEIKKQLLEKFDR